ncbi:MAG: hypothetical protein IKK03_12780 [Lachnospiraceae bacterium]|nr:hypothetical protein [Lachnospiraceae bacterium]
MKMSIKIVKSNIMLKISLVLFALVLITSHFTSGLYARYTNESTTGDFARVAAFQIETDLDHVTLGVSEGTAPSLELGGGEEVESINIPFYVESASEVAVGYSVEVYFGNVDLPDYLTLSLSKGSGEPIIPIKNDENIYVFNEFGTIAPGNTEIQREELKLIISVYDLNMIEEDLTIPKVELTVKVYQID